MPNATGYGQTSTYLPSEEELAALEAELAAQDAVPPPSATLAPAGTPPPPTQTVSYPTAGPQGNSPGTAVAGYGQQITPDPVYSEPVPAPAAYATEPQGQNDAVPAPYVPSYPSGSDLSPSGRSFSQVAGLSEAFIPPPRTVAADPLAMDQPGAAVGPLSDERYANNQRVAEFQRQMQTSRVAVPPPSVEQRAANALYGSDTADYATRAAARVGAPPPGGPIRGTPGRLPNPSMYWPNAPTAAPAPVPPPPSDRPGTPGTGARLAAPYNPATATAYDYLLPPTAWNAARRLDGTAVPPGRTDLVDAPVMDWLGGANGLYPALANLLSPYSPGRPRDSRSMEASARAVGDAVGGALLPDVGKPLSAAGRAGREAGAIADRGIDAAAEGLADLARRAALASAGRSGNPGSVAGDGLVPPPATTRGINGPPRTTTPPSLPHVGDWLRQNVLDPFLANSADTTVFGVNVGGGTPATDTVQTPPTKGPLGFGEARNVLAARDGSVPTPGSAGEQIIPRNVDGTLIDVVWQGDVPVGLIDPASGERIALTPDMTQEQVDAIFAGVMASTASKNPGEAFVPVPATGGVAAPAPGQPWPESTYTAPATATGTGSGGGGTSWTDWSNGGGSSYPSSGSRSTGGSRSSSTGGEDTARAFTADDFLDQADGDRTKAAAMAKAANRKRRTKRTKIMGQSSTMPTRTETPLRTAILAALRESMTKGQR